MIYDTGDLKKPIIWNMNESYTQLNQILINYSINDIIN